MNPHPTVALLGFGRFGRAFGSLLSDAGIGYRALDPLTSVPDAHRAGSLAELAAGADFVVLAVPVPLLRGALEALRPHLQQSQIVFDVGSVKTGPAAALMEVLGADIPWAATHPLFGPVSLSLAERPLRVVLCESPLHPGAAAAVRGLYERLGCEVVSQSPEGHDRVMASTHALTFFVAKGMLEAGAGVDAPFAPPSFQAIARTIEAVREDAGHLFWAIQNENPFAREARGRLLRALGDIEQALGEPPGPAPDPERLSIPDLGARSPELREAREHIDALDREIVGLLRRRTELARRAARAKAALGHPVLDPAREAALLKARRAWAEALGLEAEGIGEIFRAIVQLSRRAQEPPPS